MPTGVMFVGNFLSGSGRKPSVSEQLAARLEERHWRIVRTSAVQARPLRLADMLFKVMRYRAAFAVAHVEVYSGPAFLWAEAVCTLLRWLKRPYILTLHGGALPEFAERWPHRVRGLLSSAALVTAPSAFLVRRLARHRGDILVIPNALDLSSYQAADCAGDMRRLLWLRSFHAIYNPQMAVEVLSLVRREFPDALLTMVGPDEGDGSLAATRKRAEDLGISDAIVFSGAVPKPEVPRWLAQAAVFINTANIDNAPVSVCEAMAAGLSVVSTNVGGISDLVEDGRTGLLVKAADAGSMASRVCDLFRNPSFARQLGMRARKRVCLYDWTNILPQWERLLGSFLGIQTLESFAPARERAADA
jgi:glycosyltransferase involved in cell wall biosynthesis